MWGLMPGQAASLCACDPPSKSWNVLLLRILSNSTSMGEVQQYAYILALCEAWRMAAPG